MTKVLHVFAYCLACYLGWQVFAVANLRVAPNLPLFIPSMFVLWFYTTNWVLDGKWSWRSTDTTSALKIALYVVSAICACISAAVIQAALSRMPRVYPPGPGDGGILFSVAFAIGGPVFLGMIEEVLFRGIILSYVARKTSPSTAVLSVTAAYVLAHAGNELFVYQFGLYACIGILCGLAVMKSQSVVPAIVIHGSINLLMNAFALWFGGVGASDVAISVLVWASGMFATSAIACGLIAMRQWTQKNFSEAELPT